MGKIPKVFYLVNGLKCHVLSVIEDNGEVIITYKSYGRRSNRWFYKAITKDMLEYELLLTKRFK
jgi:hypothetical protein